MITSENGFVAVESLGEARFKSPLRLSATPREGCMTFVPENARVRYLVETGVPNEYPDILFEKAGPREKLFFDPETVKAAVVTCGGLSPGLNNVIRSLFFELHHNYGVKKVMGIRNGYMGLNPALAEEPLELSVEFVDDIHEEGGTVLGTSRGPQEAAATVDFLSGRGINMLFCVGGDGTQRGAQKIADEARRRGARIAVIGIPKTIDNDIGFVSTSFGFLTAIEKAREVLSCAHTEAKSALNGIGLVKLMGRDAGFIACGATLASQEPNFTIIPEVPLRLEGESGFLDALRRRILSRRHAVIVVAEGAGQEILRSGAPEFDASGNPRHRDIGPYLKTRILEFFKQNDIPTDVKYFDPSYSIRSVPANAGDAILCDQFARHAAHAAMSGRTNTLIGYWNDAFFHVPIPLSVSRKTKVDPADELWRCVLAATGQPHDWSEKKCRPA